MATVTQSRSNPQTTPAPSTVRRPQLNTVILVKIKKDVNKIEKILKLNLGYQVRVSKKDQTNQRRIDREERQDKIETKKTFPKIRSIADTIRPRLGIMESIKRFFIYTFLGFVFTRIQDYLPKLLIVVKLLKGFADFVGMFTRTLLEVFSFIIGGGYQIYDKIKGQVNDIKKSNVKKEFDSFTNIFGSVIKKSVSVVESIVNLIPDGKTEQPKSGTPQPNTPTKGAASGGPITRGNVPVNRPITRSVRTKKQPKVPNKISQPLVRIGSDVGGEDRLRLFYNSPKIRTGGNKLTKTPVDGLTNVSKTLKKAPIFGDLASIGSDVALGQKPNRIVYENTAKDVIYLAELIAARHENNVRQSLLAMAYGGSVNANVNNTTKNGNLVDVVAGIIKKSVDDRVNKALSEMRMPIAQTANVKKIEISRRGPSLEGQFYGPGGAPLTLEQEASGMYSDVYGNVSKIEMGGISKEDISALGRIVHAEAGGESALGKASVLNVILNRYRLIKSGKASPSSFEIFGKNSKNVTIRDIIMAGNGKQFSPVADGSFQSTPHHIGQKALEIALKSGGNDPEKLLINLKKNGMAPADADYVVRSVFFYNPRTSRSVPSPSNRAVMVGRHGFQQSESVKVRGKIGKIDTKILNMLSDVKVEGGILPSTQLGSKAGMRIHPITGMIKEHKGNDYPLPEGTEITSIKKGVVTRSGPMGGYGNAIEITHSDGSKSFYAHLKDIKVELGSVIRPGSLIGTVGSTGGSTGPHLHFEADDNKGNPIKDYSVLNKLADSVFRFGKIKLKPSETQKKEEDEKESKRPSAIEERAKRNRARLKPTSLINPSYNEVNRRLSDLDVLRKETIDIVHKGERFTVRRTSKNKFSIYSRKFGVVDRQTLSAAIRTNKPYSSPRSRLPAPELPPGPKASSKIKPKPKSKPKRDWWDPRGWIGKKRGGLVSDLPYIPTGYTSYERSGGSLIIAIQPMIIENQAMNNASIMPVAFPVSSGVNNINLGRG